MCVFTQCRLNRIRDWQGQKGSPGCALVQPRCWAGYPELAAQDSAQMALGCPQGGDIPSGWGSPAQLEHPQCLPGLITLPEEQFQVLRNLLAASLCPLLCSCPSTTGTLWLSLPTLPSSICSDIPLNLLFLRLNQVSQPSLTREICQSLNHPNGPLLDPLQGVSASHLLGILINPAKYSYCVFSSSFDFFKVHWAF